MGGSNGTNGNGTSNVRFAAMMSEHKKLGTTIAALRSLLSQELFSWDSARIALAEMRESLEAHFSMEESGGYLADVSARAPEKATLIAKLESEHSRMRGTLAQGLAEALVARSREALRKTVGGLLETLADHERRENELVLETFATDIPATD